MHKRAAGEQPATVLVPRGGQLSASILVDSKTGRLADVTGVRQALEALLVGQRSAGLPGNFQLEDYEGAIFVKPSEVRSRTGAITTAAPILSTSISLSKDETKSAFETLNLILDSVSRASGVRVFVGMVPTTLLAQSKAPVEAHSEPADHVIARFMTSLRPSGMAYRLLCDLTSCGFNLHVVPEQSEKPPTPVSPPGLTRDPAPHSVTRGKP